MYISYNWLQEFIKIPPKLTPEEISENLTNHTVEVESFVNQAQQFDKVVVGKILEVNKHPNADRLRLLIVDVKTEKLNIVCGAPNVAVGQLVPVALIGANLPNGLEIKESEIRGEKSYGMVCAEDELGLGNDHAGIMILKENAKIGDDFSKYLKLNDIVFEVDNKSLSNRPDLLSHYGIARELAAIFDLKLKPYNKIYSFKDEFLSDKENKLEVKVENKELCPRYMALKVDNIKVEDSPSWLKERLIAVGQRPINNIVDLTNYVMLEIGQPLHAFSSDKVKKITVRLANKNEIIETLDDKERSLGADDIVIADGSKAIAIAGLMGGKNSEINNDSKSLILEAANFKAISIRRTSQRLGLRTEASTRFEKSLDPNLSTEAVFRFLSLLKELCPEMTLASSLIDINNSLIPNLEIELDLNWLNNKIGQAIPKDTVINILSKLGFKVNTSHKELLKVAVPSWRATKDISTKEDLAEEILRLYGYDNIESKLPLQLLTLPLLNQERILERKIKDILVLKDSLTETYNYSFVGEEQLKKMNIDFFNYLRLANPLSGIQNLLRQSLVPGLAANIKTNQAKKNDLGFFEFGSVFFNAPGALNKDNSGQEKLPFQEKRLGIVLSGAKDEVFFELKGITDSLFKEALNSGAEAQFSSLDNIPGWADSKMVAKVSLLNKEVGVIAMLSSNVEDNLNLKLKTAVLEINFDLLADIIINYPALRFKEAPKYPALMRDLAFVVSEEILYNDLRELILNFNPLIKSVELFDIYSGNKLEKNEKSLAFHLEYQSDEKTMTAEEVDSIQSALLTEMARKFEAKLRDF